MTGLRKTRSILCLTFLASSFLSSEEPAETDRLRSLVREGALALESENLEQAEDRFRQALKLQPDWEPALLGLSRTLALAGDQIASLGMARQALEVAPDSVPAILAVVRQLALLGATQEALPLLEHALELAPQDVEVLLLNALLLRDSNQRDEAIRVLSEARAHGVTDFRIDEELALLLLTTDRADEARVMALESLELHGETAHLQLVLGLASSADPERGEEAIVALQRALELGSSEPGRIHLELGSLLMESQRPEEALEHFRIAAELMPDSEEAFYKLGNAQRSSGDMTAARQSLERFQELKAEQDRQDRRDLEVGTALNEAQALATTNRLVEALAKTDQILLEYPEEHRAYTLRAKIFFSQQRLQPALAAVTKAREIDPSQVENYFLEGMFLMQMNRPVEARDSLLQAVSLAPSLGEAHYFLGGIAAKLDRPGEAAAQFQRALELGVDNPGLRLGYAAALESLGRSEEAVEQEEAYRRLTEPPR
jgi:tetratricopeptide (TPR) repeat protein